MALGRRRGGEGHAGRWLPADAVTTGRRILARAPATPPVPPYFEVRWLEGPPSLSDVGPEEGTAPPRDAQWRATDDGGPQDGVGPRLLTDGQSRRARFTSVVGAFGSE